MGDILKARKVQMESFHQIEHAYHRASGIQATMTVKAKN